MSAPEADAKTFQAVTSIAQQYGVPAGIWEDVAYTESGYNAKIVSGDGAYGLFQLQVAGGGQGADALAQGYTIQDLLDPTTNAKIAMPSIAKAWHTLSNNSQSKLLDDNFWLQFAATSGHPGMSGNTNDPAVKNEAAKLKDNFNPDILPDNYSTTNDPIDNAGVAAGNAVNSVSSIADFLTNVNWLQQHWNSGLIKIGIFIAALLLTAVGLFVVIRKNQ